MRTNHSGRRYLVTRFLMEYFVLAAVVASELWLFASCATRVGQTSARQTEQQLVPNVGVYYLISEVR